MLYKGIVDEDFHCNSVDNSSQVVPLVRIEGKVDSGAAFDTVVADVQVFVIPNVIAPGLRYQAEIKRISLVSDSPLNGEALIKYVVSIDHSS